MKAEYYLSRMKSRKNPYAAKLKKPVSMRLSEDIVDYFKAMAGDAGLPYQSLINLYLRDCVMKHRKVRIDWPGSKTWRIKRNPFHGSDCVGHVQENATVARPGCVTCS